jgi:hypothetical protein
MAITIQAPRDQRSSSSACRCSPSDHPRSGPQFWTSWNCGSATGCHHAGDSAPSSAATPADEEPHIDILVKDRRETLYGHKVCLTGGASDLVSDTVIVSGNPSDSTLAVKMI